MARERNSKVRVLITGAGGSVGGWAVQLASAAGVGSVVAVCGPSKKELVRRLGATAVVDYTKQSLEQWMEEEAPYTSDLVIDCVGGATLAGCWSVVKQNGILLTVAPQTSDLLKPPPGARKGIKAEWFLVKASGSDLAEIADLIEKGKCIPLLDSVYAFDDFQAAFDKLDSGKTTGKCVIRVP